MLLLAAAFRPYIAEPTLVTVNPSKPGEKKRKFLVMFPDKSGNVFLLDKVPPTLQDPAKRAKYFREEEILPAVTFTVVNGILHTHNNTDNPALLEDVSIFLSDSNAGLGVAYLLAWEYLTQDFVKAARAAQHFVAGAGTVTAKAAADRSQAEFDQFMAETRKKTQQLLGMPTMTSAARLKPAESIAAPSDAIDVKAEVVKPEKTLAQLIKLAKAKGIPATKSWSIDKINAAMAEVDKLAKAEAKAAKATAPKPAKAATAPKPAPKATAPKPNNAAPVA